ncbi:MAG: MFS transporter [Chloroflexi bacterium]|nr:MFS transporter [Chloroflexota bacterium]
MSITRRSNVRDKGLFILGGLSSGHGIFHWVTQSFLVMLPEVKAAFDLSPLQVGSITTTREIASGIVALPGGLIVDIFRRYSGLVLAACMAGFGLGWMVTGLSPVYPLVLVGVAIASISSSIWHLPAMASLSYHFSARRGAALSFHGIGGNVGDVLGPAATGLLLGILTWQGIIRIYAAIPLFLAFVVFWSFKDIGRTSDLDSANPDLQSQMQQTKKLLRTPMLWGIILVGGLRGMAYMSFITFLPLYLDEELGLSQASRGLYMGLLLLVGIMTTPALGYLSDRIGRKMVLAPGLLCLCIFTLLLVFFGKSTMLVVILALLGIFLHSDQPILTAAALDIVGSVVATTTLGAISFFRFVLSAIAPLIGGLLYATQGINATFYFSAGLYALATAVLLAVPLKAKPSSISGVES